MRYLFILLAFLSLFFLASTSPYKQKLVGVWKIQSMEIKGVIMRHQQMGMPYIEFNEEGGFMIKLGSSAEKGRYALKGNDIRLKFIIPKKPGQEMMITRLDDTEFDYSTTDSTGDVQVKCYRITTGLEKEKD